MTWRRALWGCGRAAWRSSRRTYRHTQAALSTSLDLSFLLVATKAEGDKAAFCFWWALACGSRGFYFVELSKGGGVSERAFPGGRGLAEQPPFRGNELGHRTHVYHQHDVHIRVQRASPSVIGD